MKKFFILVFAMLLVPTFVWAQSQDSSNDADVMDYNQIVNELSRTRAPMPQHKNDDPFANVKIHGGVAFISSYINLTPQPGHNATGFLKGFEANFGIDLFSPYWEAQGAVRSFGQETLDAKIGNRVALHEFDLKVLYMPPLSRFLFLRLGFGLSARYLTYTTLRGTAKYTTPASVLVAGAEARLTDTFSLGLAVNYRSAMISETIEDAAVDGCMLADFRF